MAPVVVGKKLTAEEAMTIAQMYTEYGMEVSITDNADQYVDLTGKANSSVFNSDGSLIASAAAIIEFTGVMSNPTYAKVQEIADSVTLTAGGYGHLTHEDVLKIFEACR